MQTVTGVPELDALIGSLNKKLKDDQITDEIYEFRGALSTTSISLNRALGVGGIPRGRITELIGEPGSGKTTLAMILVAEAQRVRKLNPELWESKRDLIIDIEHTITREFMEGFDIDCSKVIHVRVSTAESALQVATDLPKTGHIDVVVYDSIAAAEAEQTIQRDYGESDVGGASKLNHQAMRRISKLCERANTTYIFINQTTSSMMMHGPSMTTPGGRALPFYASCRLSLLKAKPNPTVPGTMIMRPKIIKNKLAPPWGTDEIPVTVLYGQGVDQVGEILEALRINGALRHSAGQTKVQWNDDEELEALGAEMPKGKEACFAYVRSNPELLERLRARAAQILG
jgi:recombination protein RecA